MRNLKRALSLALAAAMLISLMVVGASAMEYPDEDSITNAEAVDVLTAVGIVGGDQNGDFNPNATLTRAEFTVMMANLLTGCNFDTTLFEDTTLPFTDVQGHWAAPYIAYCYSAGVIAGTSATTFEPDGTLTTAQAAAILLMSLGYNQNNEFAANGQFALNVTSWAQRVGLYDGLSMTANAGISRDNTAQMIFNAMVKTTPVEYNSTFNVYYTQNWANGVYEIEDDEVGVAGTSYDYSWGYKTFELTKDSSATETFGRPGAYTWCIDSKSATDVYNNEADLLGTYTAKMTYGDLYSTLGKTVLDNLRDVDVYVDGKPVVVSNAAHTGFTTGSFDVNNIVRNSKTAFGYDTTDGTYSADDVQPTGNGVLTEVYVVYDETAKVYDMTVVSINTYVAEAAADYDTRDEELTITPITQPTGGYNAVVKSEDVEGLAGFDEDDIIMLTASWDGSSKYEVQTVKAPTLMSDTTVTSFTSGESVTAGNTTYKYNAAADAASKGTTYDVRNGSTYDFYLDDYNNILYVTDYAGLSNYVYIADSVAEGNSVTGLYVTAKAVFTNGTSATIRIDKLDGADANLGGADKVDDSTDNWFTYSVNGDGNYELKTISGDKDVVNTLKSTISSSDAQLASGGAAVGNSATVFVVYNTTTKTYNVYTGMANVPKVTSATGAAVVDKDKYATYVYVEASASNISVGSNVETAYILKTSYDEGYDSTAKKTTYTYDAIVDGEITKLTLTSAVASVGLYYWSNTSDGYPSGLTQVGVTIANEYVVQPAVNATVTYSDGTLVIAGQYYVIKSGADVFTISATGTAEATTLAAIANDGAFTGTVYLVDASKTDASKVAVYFQKSAAEEVVADTETVNETTTPKTINVTPSTNSGTIVLEGTMKKGMPSDASSIMANDKTAAGTGTDYSIVRVTLPTEFNVDGLYIKQTNDALAEYYSKDIEGNVKLKSYNWESKGTTNATLLVMLLEGDTATLEFDLEGCTGAADFAADYTYIIDASGLTLVD